MSAKTCGSQTTKLLPARLQETTASVAGSSTRSNVLVRNGGGPTSCSPSIGRGAPPPSPTPSCSGCCCSRSSSLTMPGATEGSMAAAQPRLKNPARGSQAPRLRHATRSKNSIRAIRGARIGRTRSESGVRVGALGYFFSGWAGGDAAAKKRGGKGRRREIFAAVKWGKWPVKSGEGRPEGGGRTPKYPRRTGRVETRREGCGRF